MVATKAGLMGVILVVAMRAPLKLVALDFQKPRVKAVLTLMVDPSVACVMVGVVLGDLPS